MSCDNLRCTHSTMGQLLSSLTVTKQQIEAEPWLLLWALLSPANAAISENFPTNAREFL